MGLVERLLWKKQKRAKWREIGSLVNIVLIFLVCRYKKFSLDTAYTMVDTVHKNKTNLVNSSITEESEFVEKSKTKILYQLLSDRPQIGPLLG